MPARLLALALVGLTVTVFVVAGVVMGVVTAVLALNVLAVVVGVVVQKRRPRAPSEAPPVVIPTHPITRPPSKASVGPPEIHARRERT